MVRSGDWRAWRSTDLFGNCHRDGANASPGVPPTAGAAWLQLGSRGIDLYAGSVLIELEREEASGVGRERYRGPAHEFGEYLRRMLRVSRGDRKMMDHGFLTR